MSVLKYFKNTPGRPHRATGLKCKFFLFKLFFSRDLIANLKKKFTLKAYRPMGATGGIFEIFQNGHIFLKFLFLKNIKKKKRPTRISDGPKVVSARAPEHGPARLPYTYTLVSVRRYVYIYFSWTPSALNWFAKLTVRKHAAIIESAFFFFIFLKNKNFKNICPF